MNSPFRFQSVEHADLAALLALGNIGMWTLAIEGRQWTITMDDALCETAGYAPNEVPHEWNVFLPQMVHPLDQAKVHVFIGQLVAGTQTAAQIEHRFWFPIQKRWVWVSVLCRVMETHPDGSSRRLLGLSQVIHDRVVAQTAMQEEQERLDAIHTAAQIGVWDWDITNGHVFYSDVWWKMLGYEPGELPPTAATWENLIVSEDIAYVNSAIEDHGLRLTAVCDIEFRMRHKDGSIRWVRRVGQVVAFDPLGVPTRMLGTLQDITPHKEAELEIRRQNEWLDLVVTATNVGIREWNIQANTMRYSEIYREMLGYTREEMVGTFEEWICLHHASDQPQIRQAIQDLLAGKVSILARDTRLRHKDGHDIWVRGTTRIVAWDETGAPTHALGMASDITARVLAEDEVRREQERIRTVVESAEIGLWEYDVLTQRVFNNDSWMRIMRYAPGELSPTHATWYNDVLYPEDRAIADRALEDCLSGKTPTYEAEFRQRRGDGSVIWSLNRGVATAFDPITQRPTRISGILLDITGQVELKLRLLQEQQLTADLIEQFPGGFFLIDSEGRYRRWNRFIRETFPVPSDLQNYRIVSNSNSETQQRMWTGIQTALKDGTSVVVAAPERRDGASPRHFVVQISRVEVAGVPHVCGFGLDIEDQIQAEKRLSQYSEELLTQGQQRATIIQELRLRIQDIVRSTSQVGMGPPVQAFTTPSPNSSTPSTSADDLVRLGDEMIRALDSITDKMHWFRGILDCIPIGVTTVDTQNRWTYLNAPAVALIGNDLNDLLGTTSQTWWNSLQQQQAMSLPNSRAGTDPPPLLELTHPPTQRHFRGSVAGLFDSHGHRAGRVNVMWDVTDIRRAEERRQHMFDHSPLSMIYCTEQLEVIDCNQRTLTMFGVETREELTERFLSFFPEFQSDGQRSSDVVPGLLERVFHDEHIRFRWQHLRASGESFPAEITLTFAPYTNRMLVVYIQDVTELERSRRALEDATEEAHQLAFHAEAASRAKSAFLATMSHEIRTPLNGVLGLSGLLLGTELDHRQHEYTELIRTSGQSLLHLINDILDFSKIEAGKLELDIHHFNLLDMVESVFGILASRAAERQLELAVVFDPKLALAVTGDDERIRQILLNLASNAIKFTEHGGVCLDVSCAIPVRRPRPPPKPKQTMSFSGFGSMSATRGSGSVQRTLGRFSSRFRKPIPRCRAALAGPVWGSRSARCWSN